MAYRVCSVHDCPTLYDAALGSRCPAHTKQASRHRDATRERYTHTKGHRSFRRQVLARDPICVRCKQAQSTVADHWPLGRDELVLKSMDPDDPANGRGLCHACHSIETARAQPGGWHRG